MLRFEILVTPGDEVQKLRARVAELTAALAEEEARRNRAEYRYRCEVLVNEQLIDLCRASGVKFRAALEVRPHEDDPI